MGVTITVTIVCIMIMATLSCRNHLAADWLHLKHKELLSEDCQGVEASVADVGLGVGVGRLGALRRTVRSDMAVVFTGVRGRVEAGGRDRGWRPGGLRRSIRRTCKQFFAPAPLLHFLYFKIVTAFILAQFVLPFFFLLK